MNNQARRLSENVPGKFYVTTDCLACAACEDAAPDNFRFGEGGMSYVFKQPANAEELKKCTEAMEHCPMEAIWDDGT